MQNRQRHLAAILFTDIVGSTSMMQHDEAFALATLKHYTTVLRQSVEKYSGEVLNDYGDGSLCIFASASQAMFCALEMQVLLKTDPVVPLRIGLHLGEIFFEEEKIFGDGVNIASRIQSLGQANTILFSKEFFENIRNRPEFKSVSLGLFEFKNVDEPMEIFALANEGLVVPKREHMTGKLKDRKKNLRKWLIAAGVFVILLSLFLFIMIRNGWMNNNVEKSIAVLPFANMSNDPQQDYFVDGMMDEILNRLFKIGDLRIISRTSTLRYKGTKKNMKEIAKELGVTNLLEGSVQKEGDVITIRAQLIDGKKDEHLWADTYHAEFKDVFAIQSDIAQKIASSLKIKLDPVVKKRIEKIPTQNTQAYDLFLKSRDKLTSIQWKEQKKLLDSCISLDPNFAPAYAEIGFYWINRGSYMGDLNLEQAKDAALPFLNRAIQLDPNLPAAYEYFALIHLWFDWDFDKAGKDWKKVFEINPAGMPGVFWRQEYGAFLLASGRFDEALDNAKLGLKDKNNTRSWLAMQNAYFIMGEYEKSLEICDAYYKVFNDNFLKFASAANKVLLNRYKEAIPDLDLIKKDYPILSGFSNFLCYQAIVFYKIGEKEKADALVEEMKLRKLKSTAGSPAFYLAVLHTTLGDKDQALDWLEKSFVDHEVEMYWIKTYPVFKPLYGNKRFDGLLKKVGFK
jgi:adenylate cyclase